MIKCRVFGAFLLLVFLVLPMAAVLAQSPVPAKTKSQEYSESDGIPVLTKHLPDFENVVDRAKYILNADDLRNSLGNRPVFEAIDFAGGTEAVTAAYQQGDLLIVEFTTPQFSVEADKKIRQKMLEKVSERPIFYRRIGNYSAFVFDSPDEASANSLLDQISYEKEIRWLGEDPFALKRAERDFVLKASDLFTNIMLGIFGALGGSVVLGIIAGFGYYYFREQQRSKLEVFSDAGGMTRLNLDGFTPDILAERLLDK